MVTELIPELLVAFAEPGASEPTEIGGQVIPKKFTAIFHFKDKEPNKTWWTFFQISISDLGTPKLMSVEISGSVRTNPIALKREFNKDNFDELEAILRGEKKMHSDEDLQKFKDASYEPESVERWQIKLIEQYRFQLFEMGIRLGYQFGNPWVGKDEQGNERYFWIESKYITDNELKKFQKEIGTRIRKKITPDFLKEVAKIYTEAGLRGEYPTKAVQEFYKVARRTAEDYVRDARKLKFLPPVTEPGKMSIRKPRQGKMKK